jgi:hypothetical protein
MLAAIGELSSQPAAPRAPATDTLVRPTAIPTASPIAMATEVGGERRYLTVMFCDLADSTRIAARLDAEEWRDLVNASRRRLRGGDRAGRPCSKKARRRADGAVRLSGGAGERRRACGTRRAFDPARARQFEPQECRKRQAGAGRSHRARRRCRGGRRGRRDLRRRRQCRGTGCRRWASRVRS